MPSPNKKAKHLGDARSNAFIFKQNKSATLRSIELCLLMMRPSLRSLVKRSKRTSIIGICMWNFISGRTSMVVSLQILFHILRVNIQKPILVTICKKLCLAHHQIRLAPQICMVLKMLNLKGFRESYLKFSMKG